MPLKLNTLEELIGKSNFTNLISHMYTGRYSTGHIVPYSAPIISADAFSKIFCKREELTSYCHLISTCAPEVLPCVLRFVLRQHGYPCEAITLRSKGKALLITDISSNVSDTVQMISSSLTGGSNEKVRVIMCFTREKIDIETNDNSYDRFVIQVTGKTAWFSLRPDLHDDYKPAPACDPVNGFPASGIMLNENDYIFLPAGKIFKSVAQSEISLYLEFLFHTENIDMPDISIKEKHDNAPAIADCIGKFFYCSGKCSTVKNNLDEES